MMIFNNFCYLAAFLLQFAVALLIQSENVEVFLCYVPDTVNGEIIIREGGYSDIPHTVLPGTKVELKCNKGFGSVVTTAICLDDGHWSAEIGKCHRKKLLQISENVGCVNPGHENAHIIPKGRGLRLRSTGVFMPGTRVQVECEPGYQVKNGATESICLANGNWTDDVGFCETLIDIDMIEAEISRKKRIEETLPMPMAVTTRSPMDSPFCDDTPQIPYGVVSTGASHIGAQRKLVCFSGFTLMGIDLAICNQDGKWGYSGACTRDCGPAPVLAHGFVLTGTFSVGSNRKVECAPGYTLSGPDVITCKDDGQWTKPGICGKAKLFLIAGPLNFEEAKRACENAGAHMAHVTSCGDDTLIRKLMLSGETPVKNAWIGLRRAAQGSDRWRWIGSGDFLENWHFNGFWPGYPDNKDDNDDCVIYQSWEEFAVGWNDIPCNSRVWISSAIRIPYVSQDIGVVCQKTIFV